MSLQFLSQIKNLIRNSSLVTGSYAYLISKRFLSEIEDCIKKNVPIFEICNADLFKGKTIRHDLVFGKDCIAVNQETWLFLTNLLDVDKEYRCVVLSDGSVEILPLEINVSYNGQKKGVIISRGSDMSTFLQRIHTQFLISAEKRLELSEEGSSLAISLDGTVISCLGEIRSIIVKEESKILMGESRTAQVSMSNIVEKKPRKPNGICNLGNTCYMNSAIQCFANLPHFREAMPKLYEQKGTTTRVTSSLIDIITMIDQVRKEAINPKQFKSLISEKMDIFRGNGQQDVHEFSSGLIDIMLNEFKESSIIKELFFGFSLTTTRCSICGTVSNNNESYSTLSLPTTGNMRVIYIPFRCSSW